MDRLDEDGNLRATSDFRGVYCGLLEQWFGTDAAAVIPEAARFGRPALVRDAPGMPAVAAVTVCVGGARRRTAAGARRERPPARLMVSAQTSTACCCRARASCAGPALIQFLNRGEDPHDLRMRRIGGRSARRILGAGDAARATWRSRGAAARRPLPAVVLAARARAARHAREAARESAR